MSTETTKSFDLGQVVITLGARDVIKDSLDKLSEIITRHSNCDWGDVDGEDKSLNDTALKFGARILSSYTIDGHKVWVITEADRSSTTILLPSEY
jgi:hypothetical protein